MRPTMAGSGPVPGRTTIISPEAGKRPVSDVITPWWVTRTTLPAGCSALSQARRSAICAASASPRRKNEFSDGKGVTGPTSSSLAVSRQRHHSLE